MISVVIPTYKSPEVLNLCLQSCIEGQQNNNQIIVVVDGFYDTNKTVLEKWAKYIDILNLQENVGLCRGTNLGVYNARYEKVLIVNDDNIFPYRWDVQLEAVYQPNSVISPNQIEPQSSIFQQFIIHDMGKDWKSFDLKAFWEIERLYAKDEIDETGSTLPFLMNKYDYIRLGGWDESYDMIMVADWDFFLKCSLSGLKMIRSYNCHFYHFATVSFNGEKRRQAEIQGHEYARYKWGKYIQSHPQTNLKLL